MSGKAYLLLALTSKLFQTTSQLGSDTNNSTQLQGNRFIEASRHKQTR